MNSTGNVGNFAIGTPGTGGLRGVGASIMGGSGTGHPLVPQVKLSHLRSPTLEDSVMSSNGAYSAMNSGVSFFAHKIYRAHIDKASLFLSANAINQLSQTLRRNMVALSEWS